MIRFTASVIRLVLAIAAVAFLTAHVAHADGTPPPPPPRLTTCSAATPCTAHYDPSYADLERRHHNLQRDGYWLRRGCVKVAPHEYVCPLPAPHKRKH